jgi:hypothetical protein
MAALVVKPRRECWRIKVLKVLLFGFDKRYRFFVHRDKYAPGLLIKPYQFPE